MSTWEAAGKAELAKQHITYKQDAASWEASGDFDAGARHGYVVRGWWAGSYLVSCHAPGEEERRRKKTTEIFGGEASRDEARRSVQIW